MPLNDRAIKAAKPREKPYRLADGGGLYLEVSPSGGKLWRWKYRFGGREKRLALGQYPDVGLAAARERRDDARRQLAGGVDPAAAKRAAKLARAGAGTFEMVAREWWTTWKPTRAQAHVDRTLRRLEANVFPWLGTRPVGEVTAQDLLAVLRRIDARGATETAHRVRSICSQVFRYAVVTGRAERDPAADLRGALPAVASTHFPTVLDPKKLGNILRVIDGYDGTLLTRCALQLLPLLFCRPGELRFMRWSEVDVDEALWRYEVTKTKTQHIVPLATQALAVLEEVRPLTGRGEFVFPSMRTSARPMSDGTMNAALRRAGIDTRSELTGHGFRAAARTLLEEVLGYRPEIIEMQLAHTVKDPLGRAYNRTTHLEARTRMMQAWADYLDGLKGTGASVLPLRASKAV